MPVKVDPAIIAELADIGLVLWEAKHPKVYSGYSEKTMKPVLKEDKGWVLVSLAGPGVDKECAAGGPTLRAAVGSALVFYFADRVPGLRGAMLRLEKALWDVGRTLADDRIKGEYDDDIPF